MPLLTAVLPPPLLIWVASVNATLLPKPRIIKKLSDALIFSGIDNYAYFEDVCIILASAILTANKELSLPSVLTEFSETSRVPPHVPPEHIDGIINEIAKKLVAPPIDSATLSQFVWMLAFNEWCKLEYVTPCDRNTMSPLVKRRFAKIFGPDGFAKSCTYKSSGDFVVHCILRATHISSWRVMSLAVDENVYGPCAAVHGELANSVIRQYTDTAPSDFLHPRRNTSEGIKFIIMAVTVLEATNEKKSRLLIDRSILKRENKDIPQLVYTNDAPPFTGKPQFGHIIRDKFTVCKTAEEAILGYLVAAHEHGIIGVDGLYYALFDPEKLPTSSLLRQYVA